MHIDEIQKYWLLLTHRQQAASDTALKTIEKIIRQYSGAGRHYHNTAHLSDLLYLQQQYASAIQDNDSVLFAIYFHDIIYHTTRKGSEAKSAAEAGRFLKKIGYPPEKREKVHTFILATQTHQNPHQDSDLDYFLDFDLHILGAPPAQYNAYTKLIRKEYSLYPSFLYKKGRKTLLEHLLCRPYIYKSAPFREKYEKKARENMGRELELL